MNLVRKTHSLIQRFGRNSFFRYQVHRRRLHIDPTVLLDKLKQVQSGSESFEDAFRDLSKDPVGDFANLDHGRSSRVGFPEIVYGESKTARQVASILDDMIVRSETGKVFASRITPQHYDEVAQLGVSNGTLEYHDTARLLQIHSSKKAEDLDTSPDYRVVICTAGTTDLPVAQEAAVLLQASRRLQVQLIPDVGVAGLHRILSQRHHLEQDPDRPPLLACLVVAGMDGALPSVVGGLTSVPVIAVPTSIGYGAAFQGVSPLLTMLNSCSPGVVVVNIDNGVGAAGVVYKMMR